MISASMPAFTPVLTASSPVTKAPATLFLAQAQARPPGIISVMGPVGFRAFATEGPTLDHPLFTRVTYRPEQSKSIPTS